MSHSSPPATPSSPPAEYKRTYAFGIGVFLGILVFAFIVSKLSFPNDYGVWLRLGVGIGAGIISGILFVWANAIVAFSYKVMVELAAVLLLFLNAIAISVGCAYYGPIIVLLCRRGSPDEIGLAIGVVAAALAALLLVNILVFTVLHPLARIAGTRFD